jgi:hypothetical protein
VWAAQDEQLDRTVAVEEVVMSLLPPAQQAGEPERVAAGGRASAERQAGAHQHDEQRGHGLGIDAGLELPHR